MPLVVMKLDELVNELVMAPSSGRPITKNMKIPTAAVTPMRARGLNCRRRTAFVRPLKTA